MSTKSLASSVRKHCRASDQERYQYGEYIRLSRCSLLLPACYLSNVHIYTKFQWTKRCNKRTFGLQAFFPKRDNDYLLHTPMLEIGVLLLYDVRPVTAVCNACTAAVVDEVSCLPTTLPPNAIIGSCVVLRVPTQERQYSLIYHSYFVCSNVVLRKAPRAFTGEWEPPPAPAHKHYYFACDPVGCGRV